MENHEDPESKSFENEMKKARLMAEKGAKFSDFSQLPPALESQWLDQISAFDDAFNNSKRIRIKKYLGNPILRLPSELSDEEVTSELNEIMELLHMNNLNLDTICEVKEREVYRFIVEELMEQEIDDMNLAGWTTNFIYEEFYPNHEHDIKRDIEDFINTLFSKRKEYCDMSLAETLISHDESQISSLEVKAKLINFIDSIEHARFLRLEFVENQISEEGAVQKIFIDYELRIQGTRELIKHAGEGVFNFVVKYDLYYISGIDIPGLRI